MNDVLTFPVPTFVEINSHVAGPSIWLGAYGARLDLSMVGKRLYLVELVEPNGRCIMWDGQSYGDAFLAASELAADVGCGIRDRSGGAA